MNIAVFGLIGQLCSVAVKESCIYKRTSQTNLIEKI